MSLWNIIKEIAKKMLPKKTVENVLHVNTAISDRMADAIQLWSDMYEGRSPWLKEPTYINPSRIVSLGLPSLIASEKARMVTLEMKSKVSVPTKDVPIKKEGAAQAKPNVGTDSSSVLSGSAGISPSTAYDVKTESVPTGSEERAEFLDKQYSKLMKQLRRQLEYGVAKGGLVIKPYIVMYKDKTAITPPTSINTQDSVDNKDSTDTKDKSKNANKDVKTPTSDGVLHYDATLDKAKIEFDFVQADRFFPLSFDSSDRVIEAAFIQTKVNKAKERVYVRLEYHKLEQRTVTVQNLAFESTDMSLANSNNIKSASNLGNPIPLTDVSEWASLSPITVLEDVDRLLFAYFRMPEANIIDPYSPLGVSGYSRVINLIKDADMQYSRLLWEFEGGELALDVDRDALKFVTDPAGEGRTVLPQTQQRLFRKVDLNTEDTYKVFSPELRDQSLIRGLNTIIMHIEDATGLSRGTLSDVTLQEAKTATELKILKQRSYATNADIQAAVQASLDDVVYVMDVYATLYEATPPGEYEISFEWDDSIIVDSESELSKRLTLMQNGLASKLETRMWYFGETEAQAKFALQQIDEEARQASQQKVEADVMSANALGKVNGQDNAKSPADTTAEKKSTGQQADSLDNPDKSKVVDQVKTGKK